MSNRHTAWAFALTVGLLVGWQSTIGSAASPQSIAIGEQLFRHGWKANNPALGGDGLGPLFNAESCVACHQQGGAGGGGDATVNAASVGIESIEVFGERVNSLSLASLVSRFHPGFGASQGRLSNVVALPHHGGTELLKHFNEAMKIRASAEFTEEGGPTNASEVQIANASPIVFEQEVDGNRVRIQARMYQRNTTALFGAGLIDQVKDKELDRQTRLQESHPEISGRPSTLRDGRYGKFGWRANIASLVEFTDQACANEMGLQTRRTTQATDPTVQNYVSPMVDVTDGQVQAMRDFIAALPVPARDLPGHDVPARAEQLRSVRRGQALFHSVGCAVCHVPDLKPALGIYSDLLLHDMGRDSVDLNHAEPYIYRRRLVTNEVESTVPTGVAVRPSTAYYGLDTQIEIPMADQLDSTMSMAAVASQRHYPKQSKFQPRGQRSGQPTARPVFAFYAPEGPTTLVAFRLIDSKANPNTTTNSVAIRKRQNAVSRGQMPEVPTRLDRYERLEIEPTHFNQEWRTPPLWGVRQSAPYWHDGRAATLLEAVAIHDGESMGTRDRFLNLSYEDRQHLLAFLNSL